MIDVAIVGGGVAGSTTAMLLARRGLSAVVLERSTYQNLRIGETLPPITQEILTRLGVWERFLSDGHAPSFGTCAAWGSATLEANDFIFNPYGHGWHVNRARFDRMLAAAATDAGAVIREDTRLMSHRRLADGWELEIEHPGRPERLRARFLVDASGRTSCVARANGARRISCDRLVGIARLHDLRPGAAEQDSFTMVEAVSGGWWYSAFLPGRQLITVFLTDSDLRPAEPEIQAAHHTSTRLGCCAGASQPFVLSANSACLSRSVGPAWLAVGDAACSFDPLSSQGIGNAMRYGMAAGHAIAEDAAGDERALAAYADEIERSFARYLSIRQRYYRQESRWPQDPFWSRRH